MPLYKHPTVVDGVMSRGADQFAVRSGVVECPQDLGDGLHLGFPTAREVQVYENHPDTRKARENEVLPDGPTPREYVRRGYTATSYPPRGYTSKDNDGNAVDLDTARALAKAEEDRVAAEREMIKLLDGNVETVVAAVVTQNADVCGVMKAAEQDSKKRKGVLEALDARLAELAKA